MIEQGVVRDTISERRRQGLPALALVLLAVSLALIVSGCGGPTATPTPSVPTPGPSSADTLDIACGPFAADVPDCLAIVAAAAKVVPLAIVAGTHADVSNRAAVTTCQPTPSCITLTASALFVHVMFTAPNGDRASAEVVTNPLGAYVGVNPRQGP